MHPPISSSSLPFLIAEADAAASRLRRRLRLPAGDREDLRQDLLADLIPRLRAFDPERGTLGAFANRVLQNHSRRISARTLRERRATGGPMMSLDATSDDGACLADRLREDDSLAAWHGHPTAAALTERRIDIKRSLDELDRRDRAFCAAVGCFTIDQLVAAGFGSRAGLYRRLRDLRPVFAALGLRGV